MYGHSADWHLTLLISSANYQGGATWVEIVEVTFDQVIPGSLTASPCSSGQGVMRGDKDGPGSHVRQARVILISHLGCYGR